MKTIVRATSAVMLLVGLASHASAGVISTGFGGSTQCVTCGNFFDVTTFGNALLIQSLEVNISAIPTDVSVYIKSGTYVGFETNAAAWTLVSGPTNVAGLGQGNATFVDINDFTLDANTTSAFYVMQGPGSSVYYDTGASSFSNADLRLDLGKSSVSPFSNPVYDPRTWNGTINYSAAVPEPGTLALVALGLAAISLRREKR